MTGNNEQNYRPMTTMVPHSPSTTSLSYTQAIAPAPQNRVSQSLRPISHGVHVQNTLQSPFGQNNMMTQMADMEPPTHVVGSQGRRGILPSAPGRPPVTSSTGRSTMIPAKDAEGKFPCPHCTKSYLHAKHLKRHLLRHTGDRPYMCILCRDTFSRSDILKRHFQKCSIRRGNPTGASHLSHSQAHLKKTQSSPHKNVADTPMIDVNTMGNSSGMGNNNASIPIFGVNSDSVGAENGANLGNHQTDSMQSNGLKRQSTAENDGRNMTALSGSGVQTRTGLESAYTGSTPSTMPSGMNPSLAFSMPHGQNGHSYNQSYEYTPNGTAATPSSASNATHVSSAHRNEISRDGESMQSYSRNSCLFRESQGHV
ncbi:Bgt-1977 [Blumeria graminis f. sp. tritici]|uniref:Bgt-1977 n=3 Tax=Blumeria graminis TaxID=34373 RepID=A0A061HGS5_BLUGR|nr:hypothetical protein BGT96224_1977 [Blumeria graminis f. sp. tritici 96224]VCU39318.1 Bgt-1977 [Blumeria graminis f. sp. tritici]